MADITHGTWIKDGKAVSTVYQNGVKVYGRNYLLDTGTPNTITVFGAYRLSPAFLNVKIGTPITITYDVDAVNADDGLSYVSFGGDIWSTFVFAKKICWRKKSYITDVQSN